jgi:hypothetical protein
MTSLVLNSLSVTASTVETTDIQVVVNASITVTEASRISTTAYAIRFVSDTFRIRASYVTAYILSVTAASSIVLDTESYLLFAASGVLSSEVRLLLCDEVRLSLNVSCVAPLSLICALQSSVSISGIFSQLPVPLGVTEARVKAGNLTMLEGCNVAAGGVFIAVGDAAVLAGSIQVIGCYQFCVEAACEVFTLALFVCRL